MSETEKYNLNKFQKIKSKQNLFYLQKSQNKNIKNFQNIKASLLTKYFFVFQADIIKIRFLWYF